MVLDNHVARSEGRYVGLRQGTECLKDLNTRSLRIEKAALSDWPSCVHGVRCIKQKYEMFSS